MTCSYLMRKAEARLAARLPDCSTEDRDEMTKPKKMTPMNMMSMATPCTHIEDAHVSKCQSVSYSRSSYAAGETCSDLWLSVLLSLGSAQCTLSQVA